MVTLCNISDFRSRQRVSACPGLFRIVASKDGGLCRVKLPLGRLTAPQARAIAWVSQCYGNGQIEFTNRANVQIRGIALEDQSPLIETLLKSGLGPQNPEADDVRNLMVSPIQDRRCAVVADRILALLEQTERYHGLSPKFSVLLDGGEADAAVDHPHDIWFSALEGGASFAFGFAGHPPLAPQDAPAFGQISSDQVVALLGAVLDVFGQLNAQDPTIKRFRDALKVMSLQALKDHLSQSFEIKTVSPLWVRALPDRLSLVGTFHEDLPSVVRVGGVPSLGRVSPQTLTRLADLSVRANGGTMRLTPWQGVVIPHIPRARGQEILKGLTELGFAVSPDDPFAQMVACAGSEGCASALSDAKADARTLAGLLTKPMDLHVTSCAKSCASARIASFTLLAIGPSHYDLYGRSPQSQPGFGQILGHAVTIAQAAELLA